MEISIKIKKEEHLNCSQKNIKRDGEIFRYTIYKPYIELHNSF